ncbi:TIR domain-containing protein [Mycobacterium sp. BK558]|nr:TIR domain-containing protein [Mycobacterium sp. BK558]
MLHQQHNEWASDTVGEAVRKAFISYARSNKPDIDELVEHLRELGCDAWVDSSLHGGQDWWQEILHRIADCDVFIAIVSRDALNSVACAREFDWAEALLKPVLPVAIEPPTSALPRRYSRRQIIDYSKPSERDRAARRLGGGLLSLPPPPRPPVPPPQPPAAPLSYLTDLVELVSASRPLTHAEQHHILQKLEPALRSFDPDERQGGRSVLDRFSCRDDLYADVDRSIAALRRLNEHASQHTAQPLASPARSRTSPEPPHREPFPAHERPASPSAPDRPQGQPAVSQQTPRREPRVPPAATPRSATLRAPATLLALAALIGVIPPIVALASDYEYPIQVWWLQTAARVFIGIAFCLAAWSVRSASGAATTVGFLMVPVSALHVVNDILVLNPKGSGGQVFELLRNVGYPALLGLAALIAVAFGIAVIRLEPTAWPSMLIAWGLVGLVEAAQSYVAKIDTTTAPAADSVLIVQNAILLIAAMTMFQPPRRPARGGAIPRRT